MMINRTEYHKIKKYIQSLCIENVYDLAQKTGLTDYQTTLLIHVNRFDTRTFISLKNNVSESKVSKDLRKIFTKVNDYLKRNNLDV